MTILSAIRAAERYQRDANALTRLVSDAQRQARTLLGQIDVPSIVRAQEELAALTVPMERAREQVENAFGGSVRLAEDLEQRLRPSSRVLEAMEEMHHLRSAADAAREVFAPTSRVLEAMKELHQPRLAAAEAMKELYQPTSRVLEAMKELHQPRLAAAEQLATFQGQTFDAVANAVKAMEEPTRRLREQMEAITGPLERINDLVKQLDPTLRWSAQQLTEMVRWSSIDRRVARLLATRGWLGVERHLDDDELMGLLKIRGRNKGAAVDRAICVTFRRNRHARLNAMVKRWQKIPYLRDRRRIIRDAVAAHRERRYTLSITTLLPMVDGLAAEIHKAHPHLVRAKGKKGKPNLGEVVTDIVKVYDTNGRPRDYADAVIAAVSEKVFKDYHFATDPVPSTLNRHGILHGRIPGYASAVNSLRSFLLVDVMAYIAENLP